MMLTSGDMCEGTCGEMFTQKRGGGVKYNLVQIIFHKGNMRFCPRAALLMWFP